ncbi:MAG: DinB family protein [Anaerolineales bacterium]
MTATPAVFRQAQQPIETILEILTATPQRITSASAGLETARLHFRSDEKTWSANDILAHLCACADVWGKSMAAMLTQDHPTLRYVLPRTWIKKTNYPELEFRASLLAFTAQRDDLLKSLKALTIQDWSRGATFTATTLGREHTVSSYARRMALHESDHCEQIEVLLKETKA